MWGAAIAWIAHALSRFWSVLIAIVLIGTLLVAPCIWLFQNGYRKGYADGSKKPTYTAATMNVQNYNGAKPAFFGLKIWRLGVGIEWEKKQ